MKNIDNDYRIIVKNKQTIDGETNVIEELAYGSLYEKNGKWYIIYKTEEDGDRISSMIKLSDNEVSIKRSGSINSMMVYKTGEKREFMYGTPYGEIAMEIETHRIITDITENGGSVNMVYTLNVQDEKYFNDMKITVVKR
ncbi:MAG: DUF1934 domain-containing protein [Oscillospiraceae bacterium]|nr:DUF1934 domain-containing protein [Oscillospiraceae bacterium]